MTATLNVGSVTMPPGTYVLGDPCWSVPQDRWAEWWQLSKHEGRFTVGDLDGLTVLGVSTAEGDGRFWGSDGKWYPVDSGMLGVVPVELVTKLRDDDTVVTYEHPFDCTYEDEHGTVVLGGLEVQTKPEDEEEDEEDYYEEDEDDDEDDF